MRIIRSIAQMHRASCSARIRNRTIGFVPTMGALHRGHISLIRKAVSENDITVVSIFANPLQFGREEDFKKYPRDLKGDAGLCEKEGVDIIFHPGAKQMYPRGYGTYVSVDNLSSGLCGKCRPGHFKGVATVVAKLFNIVSPDTAYFGQKDAQQAVIIKKLVQDLNMPVQVKVAPIVREADGLALSSRNAYLSESQRRKAVALFHSLDLAKDLIQAGMVEPAKVIYYMRRLLAGRVSKIDYISIVDPVTLRPVKKISGICLIALAAWLGNTRLIDNITVRAG